MVTGFLRLSHILETMKTRIETKKNHYGAKTQLSLRSCNLKNSKKKKKESELNHKYVW